MQDKGKGSSIDFYGLVWETILNVLHLLFVM